MQYKRHVAYVSQYVSLVHIVCIFFSCIRILIIKSFIMGGVVLLNLCALFLFCLYIRQSGLSAYFDLIIIICDFL